MNKTIIIIIIAAAVLFFSFKEEPKKESNKTDDLSKTIGMQEVKNTLRQILKQYTPEVSKYIERIVRIESNHFKSGQWKKGNSAGMEAFGDSFPYGWSSLKSFASQNKIDGSKFSTYTMTENGTGKQKTFIKFPDINTFLWFLTFHLNKYNWDWGRWYSTKPESKKRYVDSLNAITPKLTNEILSETV